MVYRKRKRAIRKFTNFKKRRSVRRVSFRRALRLRRGRTRRGVTTLSNGNPLGGFPWRIRMKHTYIHNKNMVSSTGAGVQEQVYRLNGMYDPDYTGVGTQPNFFDDMSTIYGRYRVRGVKVRICLVPRALTGTPSTANPGTRIVIHAGDDTASYASVTTLSEQGTTPYSKEYCMTPAWCGHPGSGYGGDTKPMVFTRYYKITSFFRDRPYNSTNFAAAPTANPAQQAFLWVRAQTIDGVAHGTGSGSDFNFNILATITYFAEWSEPKMTPYDQD